MTPGEVVEFMREGSGTGKLAVTRKDCSPHVVPIVFTFDDGRIYSAVDAKPKRSQNPST